MQAGEIEINGETYRTVMLRSRTRNAYARVEGGSIVVKIPERLRENEAIEVFEMLSSRFAKRLEKIGYRKPVQMSFKDGDRMNLLGTAFAVRVGRHTSGRYSAMVMHNDGMAELRISVPENSRPDEHMASELARKALSKALLPRLNERVDSVNNRYFGLRLAGVRISRDGRSRWGSCNTRTKIININFRLLFAPEAILDYVIIHELSHLKEQRHNKRFWGIVGTADPLSKEHARWLEANSGLLGPSFGKGIAKP